MDEGAAQQLRLARLDVGNHTEHLVEDRAQLSPRERRAHAVVRAAAAESGAMAATASDVELPLVIERALVAVARGVEQDHLLAGREQLVVEFDLSGRGATEGHNR